MQESLVERGRLQRLGTKALAAASAVFGPPAAATDSTSDSKIAARARAAAASGARSKAIKSLVGGMQQGTTAERARWGKRLIPRSAKLFAQNKAIKQGAYVTFKH